MNIYIYIYIYNYQTLVRIRVNPAKLLCLIGCTVILTIHNTPEKNLPNITKL